MTLLQSKRLVLVAFALCDADALFRIRSDAKAMEFWDWPADETPEDTHAIARAMLDDIQSGATRIWTIRRADGESFVGVIDLSEIDGSEANLGFMILRECWGRGYAFEAASLVIGEAWREGLVRLGARTHAGNRRSRGLLQKLGFVENAERNIEVRPGVVKACSFFTLDNPCQGSSSLSQ
jgi:RimJ/RimL family protein N-acetyltransferase